MKDNILLTVIGDGEANKKAWMTYQQHGRLLSPDGIPCQIHHQTSSYLTSIVDSIPRPLYPAIAIQLLPMQSLLPPPILNVARQSNRFTKLTGILISSFCDQKIHHSQAIKTPITDVIIPNTEHTHTHLLSMIFVTKHAYGK